ncbi:NlpC/P60 family protein [Streptomyces shenzhenensis]|uniref:C40 family peptidase n=1 Tax=Streptomyces shenzhenensis TaxID=943815 RepID=UPI0037FAA365
MRRTLRAHGRRTAGVAALALALTATVQQPARAEPTTLAEVRAALQRLYHDAEVATDKYNAADVKVTRQEKRVRTLRAQVGAAERRLTRLTALAGAAARAQYRGGGLPAEVQFVLSDDPRHALENASLARQAQQGTQLVITAVATTSRNLRADTDEASDVLNRLRANRRTMDTERGKIEKHIAAAKRLESRLAASQRRELDAMDTKDANDAQAKWVSTGILGKVGTTTTAAGKKAVEHAAKQIGKPYVWGAEGPDAFDCSGLTSQAWLAAGVVIPRTSEEQWRRLPHIPVESMRPGDLIIYFSDASHVAIYIGNGEIISAPRPGRNVYISPAGSMEILGVVRPEA